MDFHRHGWTVGICLALRCACAFAEPTTWDMGAHRRFDATNRAYALKDGHVVVDLSQEGSLCPNGLGELAEGREPVREIRIVYTASKAAEQWLHITWEPGSSGQEQFEVLCNGSRTGTTEPVDAAAAPGQKRDEVFPIRSKSGRNTITLKHLSGDGLRFSGLALTNGKERDQGIKPTLKYPTLASFEKAIGRRGVLLESEHVLFFAPQEREAAARIVMPYLVRAYDELYRIVGVHTRYKIAVYAFPRGNREGWGGTEECSIEYDDRNLDLAASDEWEKYKAPHVSGLIEEMAHNFVHVTGVQFGWEMVGWSLGVKVAQKVAPNPIFAQELKETREGQVRTYQRYKAAGHTFPEDLPANQCDRIHAFLLWRAEQQYGPGFWSDFFKQVREAKASFAKASQGGDDDEQRNARYRVTIECFEKLPKIQFKKTLAENGISLTTDVKSLRPKEPGWNRKLR